MGLRTVKERYLHVLHVAIHVFVHCLFNSQNTFQYFMVPKLIYIGAICIKKLLVENKMMTSLNVGYNQIGDEGVASITEGLLYNNTVTTVITYGCGFSGKGIYSLI